jgi:hypothetical protein
MKHPNAVMLHFTTIDLFAHYLSTLVPGKWFTKVCVHHTYLPNELTWKGRSSMEGMLRFYVNQKGWDRFPHVFAAADGIWVMNKLTEWGIHANAANDFTIGVEVVGYYDKKTWQDPIKQFAVGSIRELQKWGKLDIEDYVFHREYNKSKTCPGVMITREYVTSELEAYDSTHKGENYTSYKVIYPAPVHQGPAFSFQSVGRLHVGEVFRTIAHKDDELGWKVNDNDQWVHITRHPTKSGWGFVHTEFLEKI